MKCCLFCTCVVLSSVPQLESEPAVKQIGEVPENAPFLVPEKWKWCNFGNVVTYGKCEQVQPQNIEEDAWILDLEDIESGTGNLLQKKKGISVQSNKSRFKKGDVLYSKLRPYLNKVIVADDDGYCTTEIVPISLSVAQTPLEAQYLKIYLMSPYFVGYANQCSYGVKMPRLGTKDAKKALFPIPPIEEQRRIVAKLNELLPLVETYGKEQEALEKMEKEFPDKLRASLLQEAIQGKLVPQLESEPEVTQIGEAPEDVPFAIPEKWKWISASYVQTLVRGITFPASAKTKMQTHKSICCLTTGSVQEKYASKADVFVDQSFMKNTRQILQVGDVVISSANSKELVGKSILWEDDSGIQKTFGGFLTVARVKDSQTMIPEYLFLVYRYMFKTGYFANLSTQTTNIANLSNKLLDSLVFPIPPLEEQHRIAAKLNELLGAVVQLENTISAM